MDKYNITISVIIPTYNRANTIERCIKSVQNQSVSVSEIIVVDDCSTDNTIEIVSKLPNVTLLQTNKNSGAQTARNIGIKAARSEWIAFIDSDDEWLPFKIEKQIEALKSFDLNPLTVVHGNCMIIDNNSSDGKTWSLPKIEGPRAYEQLLTHSGTFFPAIITSKTALERIGFLDEDLLAYQEWDTAIRLAEICSYKHISEPLFKYNVQSDSISKIKKDQSSDYFKVVKKHIDEIIEICGKSAYNKHLLVCASLAMNFGNFQGSRKYIYQLESFLIKKYILLLLSYIRIKPKYIFKSINYLKWKKR